MIKIGFPLLLALAITMTTSVAPHAQDASPTTKVLAIGIVEPGLNRSKLQNILPQEVKDTVDLYLRGSIDQWYSLKDRNGVVFLLNVGSVTAAREMLERLPLAKAHLMSFQLIPLGPLDPLRHLGRTAPGPVSSTTAVGSYPGEPK